MFPSCWATTMWLSDAGIGRACGSCSAMNHAGSAMAPMKPATLFGFVNFFNFHGIMELAMQFFLFAWALRWQQRLETWYQ